MSKLSKQEEHQEITTFFEILQPSQSAGKNYRFSMFNAAEFRGFTLKHHELTSQSGNIVGINHVLFKKMLSLCVSDWSQCISTASDS